MPGTTPVYGFPYLTGTDGGKQIKTVSEALALVLEATLANAGQVPLDADLVSLMQRIAALEAPGETATDGIVSLASESWTLISQEGFRKGGRAQIFVVLQRTGDALDFATSGAGWFMNLLPGWQAHMRAYGQGVASTTETLLASNAITGSVAVGITRVSDQRVDYMRRGGVGSLPVNGYFGVYLDYALKTD